MQCQEIRSQFTDYLSNKLGESVRSEVQEHLAGCAACQVEAEDLKTIWTNLASIPAVEPGSDLRARFDVMLDAYKQGLDHAPSSSWWQNLNSWLAGWWPRQPVFQVIAAVALLVVGVVIGQRVTAVPAPEPNPELGELRNELSQMRQLVVLSLMQQQSASERLRGVSWSSQLQKPDNEVLTALLDTLTRDPNVSVRLAVIDALRQFGDQPVVRHGAVQAIARQDSPMVQIALIDFVVDLREKESVETLQQLAKNETLDQDVRARAEKGLMELE
jgi:hypothetical protein